MRLGLEVIRNKKKVIQQNQIILLDNLFFVSKVNPYLLATSSLATASCQLSQTSIEAS